MPTGTTGFVGQRLTEGREARGLSMADLGERVGVTRMAISQYEGGQRSPRPEVMAKIAAELKLPVAFFLRPARGTAQTPVYFRSMSSATKTAATRARRRLEWLRDLAGYLADYVNLPPVNLPDLGLPADPQALTTDMIEDAATRARRHWRMGDGPISNVVWLLENSGVVVGRVALEAHQLDGLSAWFDDGRPYILLAADKERAARSRFDAAHELGHVLLHRHVPTSYANTTSGHRLLEQQAHRFASAFLLPRAPFAAEAPVPTLETFVRLKERWRVSIKMMIHRAVDLHFVPEQTQLWRALARRGWSTEEPLDDALPVERPRLLARAVELLLDERVMTRSGLVAGTDLAQTDVETLAALPRLFLNEEHAAVVTLKIKPRTESGDLPKAPITSAEVIPLRRPDVLKSS